VRVLRETVTGVLNLEMAATEEMLAIALATKPDFCTLVPEKREERTTEGGLAVEAGGVLEKVVRGLKHAGIGVSLFIDPEPEDGGGFAASRRRHGRAAHGRLLQHAAAQRRARSASSSGSSARRAPPRTPGCVSALATASTTSTSGPWRRCRTSRSSTSDTASSRAPCSSGCSPPSPSCAAAIAEGARR
jgi:hypothetical protein